MIGLLTLTCTLDNLSELAVPDTPRHLPERLLAGDRFQERGPRLRALDLGKRERLSGCLEVLRACSVLETLDLHDCIKLSGDLEVSNKMTLRAFYDQQINKPKVSTSFATTNISSGIALRFNLTQ